MYMADLYEEMRERDPKFAELMDIATPGIALAINVNRLRNERNMSQEELARAAGMRQPRIARLESGEANPRLETITRVALALGVTPGELITLQHPLFLKPDADELARAGTPAAPLHEHERAA